MVGSNLSSYRTYEEWKRWRGRSKKGEWNRFLPYLWGMETANNLEGVFEFFWVLTVPMRNGNVAKKVLFKTVMVVLTVPMRNGNTPFLFFFCEHLLTFLPYLWGMETSLYPHLLAPPAFGSYRTYEEWKHIKAADYSAVFYCSYRTYEEWKPNEED